MDLRRTSLFSQVFKIVTLSQGKALDHTVFPLTTPDWNFFPTFRFAKRFSRTPVVELPTTIPSSVLDRPCPFAQFVLVRLPPIDAMGKNSLEVRFLDSEKFGDPAPPIALPHYPSVSSERVNIY